MSARCEQYMRGQYMRGYAAKCSPLLSVAHDDCCCAGRAVEFEYMALLCHNVDFASVCCRPVCARDRKSHLDIALKIAII